MLEIFFSPSYGCRWVWQESNYFDSLYFCNLKEVASRRLNSIIITVAINFSAYCIRLVGALPHDLLPSHNSPELHVATPLLLLLVLYLFRKWKISYRYYTMGSKTFWGRIWLQVILNYPAPNTNSISAYFWSVCW